MLLRGSATRRRPVCLLLLPGYDQHTTFFLPRCRFIHRPAGAVNLMIESRIYIRAAAELNCHPHLMFGRFGDVRRFRRDELIWVLSSTGRSWHRRSIESAEVFEARVVRDLAEAPHEAMVLVG
jgi:hypothetical protein